MKKLLILLLLLNTSIGIFAQFIPGVVASSHRIVKEESGEPGEPPEFLMTDSYTFTWLKAEQDLLTFDGVEITDAIDAGPNGNDWKVMWFEGPRWDVQEEAFHFMDSPTRTTFGLWEPNGWPLPLCIYIVHKRADLSATGNIAGVGMSTLSIDIDDEAYYMQVPGGWLENWEIPEEVLSDYVLYRIYFQTDLSGYDVNNGLTGDNLNVTITNTTTIHIGAQDGVCNGFVKEVIVRSIVDNNANINAISNYLMTKYNIQ
jgi:hypothetical protein